MPTISNRGESSLALLKRAATMARAPVEPEIESFASQRARIRAGELASVSPSQAWPEIAQCLTALEPARSLQRLRLCGAFQHFLPDVEALFGVPQIAEGDVNADLGELFVDALSQAELCEAKLSVRFALMVMNVGKADSPREHLPVHYRHIERGRPRIEAICARFETTQDCLGLALLALAECERVHRVSRVRAGPVAAMLERLDAFGARSRFEDLMTLCACDFRAYPGRSGQPYPKAAMLAEALDACLQLAGPLEEDELLAARAKAIAKTFASERWADAGLSACMAFGARACRLGFAFTLSEF
jgi:tRNA nucleotidyltransferase (CCA-adding enzyme)